jgi:hypothetical protein
VEALLGLEGIRHRDDRPVGYEPMQKGDEERLRGATDARTRARAALLQALQQGPHSGSFLDGGDEFVGHRP